MLQKIFITGASRGIGKAVALRYAQNNSELFITARNEENLKTLTKEIEELGSKAHYMVCDVSIKEQVDNAVKTAFEKMGKIDIAILNAGLGITNSLKELDVSKVRTIFDTNFFGVLNAMEELIPRMKGTNGVIAGVSSLADFRGISDSTAYSSSKIALTRMLEGARVSLKKEGIHIATIRPGFVKTDMTDQINYKMPFLITPEKAANFIYNGIKKRKRYIDFPCQTSAMTWLIGRMPDFIFEWILRTFGK